MVWGYFLLGQAVILLGGWVLSRCDWGYNEIVALILMIEGSCMLTAALVFLLSAQRQPSKWSD